MIYVNVRGLVAREYENRTQLVIQLRSRKGDPEVYEFPGGRLEEYESIVDGLKREIREETGLCITTIRSAEDVILTRKGEDASVFSVECMKPFCAYQTVEGPVDSFGLYFICEAEGALRAEGDDTANVHWADLEEIRELIQNHAFSEIDLPAAMMFLREGH